MDQSHLHPIDRKPPPKIRKEGPKAQERYVEELHNTWIGGHVLNSPTEIEGDRPPQGLVDHAALLEEETRQHMAKRDALEAASMGFVTETDPKVIAARRGMHLVKKADWQMYMYDRIDPEVIAEIAQCKLIVDGD